MVLGKLQLPVLLIWIRVGQVPTTLAVGVGGGLFRHFFSRLSFLFILSLSLVDGLVGWFDGAG